MLLLMLLLGKTGGGADGGTQDVGVGESGVSGVTDTCFFLTLLCEELLDLVDLDDVVFSGDDTERDLDLDEEFLVEDLL